ncbi:hypothetical protein VD0001_g3244 [Verticillium dahliae]|nr:hypothetical protein VD0001_g3244 [Verticillium dahliae]
MLLHGAQSPPPAPVTHHQPDLSARPRRKRKAETQDNERLSKRLSLLNLEQNGQKLYVPVETPPAPAPPAPALTPAAQAAAAAASPANADDDMHLDDTKHKVYIYSLDDELSSSDSDPDDGRLVFLPDIERHLRAARLVDPGAAPLVSVPRPIPPAPDGSLAGMQVVLYQDPASLTVPTEKDSVRKAIIESRARTRARQRLERDGCGGVVEMPPRLDPSVVQGLMAAQGAGVEPMATGHDDDADAMDLD